MGKLHIKAAEFNYKEHDRWLNEQSINGINDEEIVKELNAQRNMSAIDSEQVLMWAQRVETWRALKKALDKMKNVRDSSHA